ncbi:MAG: hypothetical protein JWM27_2493, partial [Gemmatimonadetes bacterium]|nr:hypothetical protein [Gemmatimonadota bacterium]
MSAAGARPMPAPVTAPAFPAGGGEGQAAAPADAYGVTRAQRAVILFLVTFLLVFPKGGVKVGGVPLTWGYLALAPLSLALPLALLSRRPMTFQRSRLRVLCLLAPFQALSLVSLLAHGYDEAGFTISFVVSCFFLPVMFVLVLGMHLDRLDLGFVLRLVRTGVFLVAAYGIFLFFYKFATGHFIEVPYLTVNAGDLGELEGKSIDRGGIFKLISTYNNGNLYGTCILILLPLYCWMERSTTRRSVVKLSLLLSLSRTVWIGIALNELIQRLYVRRPTLRSLLVMAVSLAVLVAGVLYCVHLLKQDVGRFIFDRNLGGREVQWSHPGDLTLLPGVRFATVLEMVYLSMLYDFGVLGLALYVLGMAAPLALHLAGALPQRGSEYKRALAAGVAIYLIVSLSDGGLLFIPIMAFYWFVVSLLLSDNPTFERVLERRPLLARLRARLPRRWPAPRADTASA